jgi:CTP:molybdopterin cytidylyltransferase MocA
VVCKQLRSTGATPLKNYFPELGYSGSILTALEFFGEVDALLITPIDCLGAEKELIEIILKHAQNCLQPKIIVPYFKNKPGHPVIFSKHFFKYFKIFAELGGPKILIKKNATHLVKIPWHNKNIISNFNHPKQYLKVLAQNPFQL